MQDATLQDCIGDLRNKGRSLYIYISENQCNIIREGEKEGGERKKIERKNHKVERTGW